MSGKARVFSTTLGHNNATVADPRYLDLVTRGLLWACGKLSEDGKPLPGTAENKRALFNLRFRSATSQNKLSFVLR
jgi:type 1 glutamine amidotransferase